MGGFNISGTPIVYNRETILYENESFRWIEVIESGAARDALLRAEQVLLWNHDSSKPMASRKNNTLEAWQDNMGVHIKADAGGTVWGREGVEAIRSGLVNKMSFGFYLKEGGYSDERTVENGKRILKRTIKKFDRIVDFSPVTYPAYQDTAVSARDESRSYKAGGLQRRYGEAPTAEGNERIEDIVKRHYSPAIRVKPANGEEPIEDIIKRHLNDFEDSSRKRNFTFGPAESWAAANKGDRDLVMGEFLRLGMEDPAAVTDLKWRNRFAERHASARLAAPPSAKECERLRERLKARMEEKAASKKAAKKPGIFNRN